MHNCIICNKSFKSALALAGHKRMHGNSNGKIYNPFCCCLITKKEIEASSLIKFQSNIKYCKQCNNPLDSNRIFCNHSCAATYNNNNRTEEQTEKRLKSLNKTIDIKYPNRHLPKSKQYNTKKDCKSYEILGKYSKIFIITCAHCNCITVSRIKKKYCSLHTNLYSKSSKSGFKFTFNVYQYPELFDINLLKEFGWFSPGGKAGKWNPNGISRDHKVSINESIRNNYDPYYITHPLNCELMIHKENNKKKTKSSITYEELKTLVNEYDLKKIY